jgi:NADH-quinone oxidoreductase subunit K
MVDPELALLHNYLIVGALLFGIGMIGFLTRRNMIIMFLSLEMMLQGVSLSLVAWGRYHNNFDGQMLVIFMVAVAACEAAIALALVLMLFAQTEQLDVAAWQSLREDDQPPYIDEEIPEPRSEPPPQWPHLPPAGVSPQVSPEETDYRQHV